jgi:hypothetical protein
MHTSVGKENELFEEHVEMVVACTGWLATKATVINEVADKQIRCPCWVSISQNSHLLRKTPSSSVQRTDNAEK